MESKFFSLILENILYLLGAAIVFLLVVSEFRPEKTRLERYIATFSELFLALWYALLEIIHHMTESSDERKKRKATEIIFPECRILFQGTRYLDMFGYDSVDDLIVVNDRLIRALNDVGLSEDEWRGIGRKLVLLGSIHYWSFDRRGGGKLFQTKKSDRKIVIENYVNSKILAKSANLLLEALSYFGINKDEWVEKGYSVVQIYNLYKDMEDYDFIKLVHLYCERLEDVE